MLLIWSQPVVVDERARDGDDNAPRKSARPKPQAQLEDTDEDDKAGAQPASSIIVTGRRLDAARTRIDTALGASVYQLENEGVEARPGGETGSIGAVLAQAPGVRLSGASLAIRGSRAVEVRINNVIIPEAIADPADELSTRLAESTRLITGTLPAQFGFAPGGVISVTTKSGLYEHRGQAELFGDTRGMVEPALEWAGSTGRTSLFGALSFERQRSTLADAAGYSGREVSGQFEGLAFADHLIDADDRVSFILGGSGQRQRIDSTSIGVGTERNDNGFGIGTFQHSSGSFTLQASLFAARAKDQARFVRNDARRRGSAGTQIDASYAAGPAHTIRAGLLVDRSTEAGGTAVHRTSVGTYVQDEWKLTPTLTFNPGARVDWLRGFDFWGTIEPRASLVLSLKSGFTAHAGYARYAAAAPLGEERSGSRLRSERDDYVDLGVQQRSGPLTLGIDGYLRKSANFIVERAAIGEAESAAFGFQRARFRGIELSATYARGRLTAWANASLSHSQGRTIVGGEALFTPATIAVTEGRWTALATDQPLTLSGGFTRRWGKLSLGADLLAGSGAVRTIASGRPNGGRAPAFATLGLSAVYHTRFAGQPADLRADLSNVTNTRYRLSDAANLEGGWTRFSQGRALMIGIEQGF